jgi:hypothetical protein
LDERIETERSGVELSRLDRRCWRLEEAAGAAGVVVVVVAL